MYYLETQTLIMSFIFPLTVSENGVLEHWFIRECVQAYTYHISQISCVSCRRSNENAVAYRLGQVGIVAIFMDSYTSNDFVIEVDYQSSMKCFFCSFILGFSLYMKFNL